MKDRIQVCQKEIETVLEEVTAVLLKDTCAEPDFEAGFLELGINSVLAVELVESVNKRLDIHLGIEVVFDYRGIKELARHIIDKYGPEICLRPDMAPCEPDNVTARDSDIAIIGISGRFAGSDNIAVFWEHLLAGNCCIKEINRQGWEESRYYDPNPDRQNRSVSKWGGFLTNIDKFDALFFNISPLEAERMDPQQRLFMEEAFKAFEDGGYSTEQLSGKRIGVFVGGRTLDYKEKTLQAEEVNSQTFLGNDMSILAARISYFLNIKGPSLAVDTACSSSLAAVHLACESIRRGESEIALAGGVFVLSSPEFYVMTSKTGMLSPDGKCKTFDNSANGIVVGEGIGALVVKRLGDALRDGDHIYGVIKGSAINQDGRTKGITAPSMLSQKALLCEAYQRADINPETVSYIEAHGTGTKLGDPIEIKALTEAFRTFTDKTRFCAIGSHKPNFGHTIMSAGIGGVFKILMAMKHRTIPPTINIEKTNEHIDFDNSPFYLNTEPIAWESVNGLPLRAGVSSFGFSGTNCHVIIEEPPVCRNNAGDHIRPCYMFPFSAKTETALTRKLNDMAQWLEREGNNCRLADVSYTLFAGRSHFPVRCVLIAGGLNELKQKLKEIGEKGQAEGYFTGTKKSPVTAEPASAEYGGQIVAELAVSGEPDPGEYRDKLQVLAELYVKGYSLDWGDLYKNNRYYRVPLPAYPFAGQSYWIPESGIHKNHETDGISAKIHPLVHENTSDFTEQRFTSVFTGHEFFLADHLVNRQRVLPGVAYLEMARAAVIRAAAGRAIAVGAGGSPDDGMSGLQIRNVVWAQPIIVGDDPVRVHTGLFPEDEGRIDFEIYSEPAETDSEQVVHCQGSIFMGGAAEPRPSENQHAEPRAIDIAVLKAQCPVTITSARCYDVFREMGLDYGPGHRGLEEVYAGRGQVLARLVLPVHMSGPENSFTLHPSLMDAALQASIVLMTGMGDTAGPEGSGAGGPMLPFALREIEVFGKCVPVMWAMVRYSSGSGAGDKVAKIDIDLCDETGVLCVRLTGFSARIPESAGNLPGVPAKSGLLVLYPEWREKEIPVPQEDTATEKPGMFWTRQLIFLCEPDDITRKNIETRMSSAVCLSLQSGLPDIEERFRAYTTRVFNEIQAIFTDKSEGKVLFQVVVTAEQGQEVFSGFSGLLKTARLENPKLAAQLIEVEPGEDAEGIIRKLKHNSFAPDDIHIRYRKGQRFTAGWSELGIPPEEAVIPWKDRGIYLVTGGAGGLGLIFAREIALKAREVTLILAVRSALNAEKRAQLRELEKSGARVEYRQVDVTRKEEVAGLIDSIIKEEGYLNGIIHCAGVLRDSFVFRKTGEELQEVLAPKVYGTVNLDRATKDLELDFFVLFSSIAGSLGNPGQADYSAANAFMDSYARYRNILVASGQRSGQTLSVNWPLWKDGGMGVDKETEKMLLRNLGMTPMDTGTGIRALYLGLASGKDQVLVMEGVLTRMKQKLLDDSSPNVHPGACPEYSPGAKAAGQLENISGKVRAALIQAVSKMLKVNREDIDSDTELSEYGFDSILFTQFTNRLNEQYRLDLNPTIFFEYPTIHSFAAYLVREYQAELAGPLNPGQREAGIPKEAPETVDATEAPAGRSRRSRFVKMAAPVEKQLEMPGPEPVAIVGMSGIFPMARDLEEFWHNLAEGRDCITEIPRERWDWREYYGDPAREINKSNIKWGGFIDGADEFDPLFFGISPKEAEVMDPQQRLLMTYVWKVIEDAGYSAQSLSGTNTGMFIGTVNSGYNGLLLQTNIAIEGYSATGSVPSVGPNRMSYFLNIHGPSEPIETACSSSLVAVHRAVQAIRDGSCEMAVAGGINIIITPELHISFSKAGMLCEDGRCKTFSDKANGYVRGEGAGMLFLKKLKAAEEAGDHIYGVIRGSAENHGGRANSLTSPNPKAQAELLINAYTRAGIDPRTVTYIEAHGTGTELGDPIEINGLKAAFGELYRNTGDTKVNSPHCGLGSVKTNVGHLELAAGIAGLIKVLLQFKHKTLVKSLHCDTVNPYIKLEGSPFYLVRETQAWKPLKDAAGRELPRRAGVSSFGFGGANAHVVIEEYIPPEDKRPQVTVNPDNPAIIVLSAKNEERLQEQVRQLLTFLRERHITEAGLADMAFTLQLGREPMEERLAAVAGSARELEAKLQDFITGSDDIPDVYRGQAGNNKETLGLFAGDEDMALTIKAWFKKRKYAKLLDLWVRGFHMDWDMLYGEAKPRRNSLPTYPFARERYWVPKVDAMAKHMAESLAVPGKIAAASALTALIHPLLHCNTSTLLEQRFTSNFSGQEFFLADHLIRGLPVLPAAACLEMTREAAVRAAGPLMDGAGQVRLQDVIWLRPISVAEGPVKVHIGLHPGDNGEITFNIYGESGDNSTVPVIYSQGSAVAGRTGPRTVLDIESLLKGCEHEISAFQCYEEFSKMGISYGPAHRGIKRLYAGTDRVLAELSLPISGSGSEEIFVLHPCLLDSAFQAIIGFKMNNGCVTAAGNRASAEPPVPYALRELEIIDKCRAQMWALVSCNEAGSAGEAENYDIDLCDREGNVCVHIRGLAVRKIGARVLEAGGLEREARLAKPESDDKYMMLYRDWQESAAVPETSAPEYQQRLVVLCEPGNIDKETLEARLKGCRCLILESGQEEIEERFESYAANLFNELRSILREKNGDRVLVQVVVFSEGDRQLLSGLAGFLKTARLENPKLSGQLIEFAPGEDIQGLTEKLQENSYCLTDSRVKYEGGKRLAERWREAKIPDHETNIPDHETDIPWQDRGIYLITGGAGGLGLLLAREIAGRVREPVLILTGRGPLSEARQAKLKELEAMGAWVDYKQADMTKKRAVVSLIQRLREDYGHINGIIHCAGVVRDNFIIKKTAGELLEVLGPKVRGLVNLDLAARDMAMDFLILCSSVAGALGNPGQADYAAANAFMDAYARYRNGLVAVKQRHGQTLAVNWPLWKEGGMGVDRETEQRILQDTGIAAMETITAIRALYRGLRSETDQVMPVTGNFGQVRRLLRLDAAAGENRPGRAAERPEVSKQKRIVSESSVLRERIMNYVIQTLVNTIKIDSNRIKPETPFAKYGIDSIVQVNVVRELEKVAGALPKTLLFEYGNIRELTDYLAKHHEDSFEQAFKVEPKREAGGDDLFYPPRHRFMENQEKDHPIIQQESEDIAVIGISGRYPLADNLDELWGRLTAGHNCITEAPPNRWRNSLSQALSGENGTFDKEYYGGFLNNINRFDHHLFEIPQDRVGEMTPELRLFLETVWETFENAGYTQEALQALQTQAQKGVGVFVGTMYSQYPWSLSDPEQAVLSSNRSDWEIANRTSHFFNLTGPSMAVNSACSSSMTAIHLACESLKQKSCAMAIAGGVNLTLHPSKYESLQQTGFLGSGSQSRSFGAGDGYIPGEGVGAVLLKPFSSAVKDHDRVYGVIKGSFVNHSGGRQKYTAPDPKQQARLIEDSLQRAGIDPGTVTYIECAANGSELGDPIEVIALNNAFKKYTGKVQFCALGSVKSNVGHLEAASGICQLSKVLLQLRHKTLVPSINADPRNPNIRLEGTAFYLQEETGPWKALTDDRTGHELPRRSMINSFGAGGSYANLIIEEYTGSTSVKVPQLFSQQEHLFVFSAKTQNSLLKYLEKMRDFLKGDVSITAESVARSLQRINHALEYRAAVVASSPEELLKKLEIVTGTGGVSSDADIYTSFSITGTNSGADTGADTGAANQGDIQQAPEEGNLRLLAQYWAAGKDIDLRQLYKGPEFPFTPLPGYVFDYESDDESDDEFTDISEDELYLRIFERVSRGELSKNQFIDFIMT